MGYIMDLRAYAGHRPLIQVGAAVLVEDGEGRLLLQKRTDDHLWSFSAAGSMEPGESAEETARRELLEETGYVSDHWSYLFSVPSNATIADNYAHIFKAENCKRSGEQKLDETEFLNVRTYTPDEIEEMISRGRFQQAVHVLAWLLARRK